jgi:tRNA modification GTPase
MLVALVSPPGRGALAVVHLAGPGSADLARRALGRPLDRQPRFARLRHRGELVDEVLACLVDGFTGEETVEITPHGGPAVVDRVLAALADLGARRCGPAELLEHAVRLGRLDRLQAEAWTLLPGARTLRAARMLRDQAEGALSRAVDRLDTDPDLAAALLRSAPLGRALAEPRRVVLAGLPNAGKSTLFNALLDAERAVVSPEPGTTRDPVRAWAAVDGVPFELVDTAGVEAPRDPLEAQAIERTRSALHGADLVVFVSDPDADPAAESRLRAELPERPRLEARSKGGSLEAVRRAIREALAPGPVPLEGAPVVFTERQERLLRDPATWSRLR